MSGPKLVACHPDVLEIRSDIAKTQRDRSTVILCRNFEKAEELTTTLKRQRSELMKLIRRLKAEGWQ